MRLFSKSCHLGFITIVLGGLLAPPLLRADNTCVTALSGLVSWWRAEGDAKDSADGNDNRVLGERTGFYIQ